MILTRSEFVDYFENIQTGIAAEDGPLWIPETYLRPCRCEWFVKVQPLCEWNGGRNSLTFFHAWCQEHMSGQVRCFSSDSRNNHEWWGFTDHNDIAFWLLRWST